MSYQPDLYDIVTSPTLQGDVQWYCEKARQAGGPVLELGAGTGRVTLPMAAAGASVHALDASGEMLARLRSKLAAQPQEVQARVTVVQGDMRTFELAERFALIVCPCVGELADRFGLRGLDAIRLAFFELLLERAGEDDEVTFSTADDTLARTVKRLG
jgi:predicted RNA methylase